MWDSIKNDPIIKTVVVIILGVLAFGFAFNVMFGANSSGMESGGMGGGSYSLGNTLSYTLSLLIQIALILVVVGAIIAAIKYFKKYIIDGNKFTGIDLSDKKSVYRYVIYGAGALLVLVVLSSLMNGTSSSNMAVGTMQNNGNYAANTGSQFSILTVLGFFVKMLLFLSTAGLIVASFMYFKNEYLNKNVTIVTNVTPEKKIEKKCKGCGVVLKDSWKCCPNCGDEVDITTERDQIIEPPTTEEVSKDIKEIIEVNEETVLEENIIEEKSESKNNNKTKYNSKLNKK